MGKKRKQKNRSVVRSAKDNYERGMDHCFNEENFDAALKYLLIAAKSEYKPAYGEIGIILNREKNESDRAEEWFKKAEKESSLFPLAAYEYGMLLYLVRIENPYP